MAKLTEMAIDYLRKIAKGMGLIVRNWSHDGKAIFAVYKTGDDYIGVVEIDPYTNVMKIAPGMVGLPKREGAIVRDLITTWNAARGR